MSLLINEDLKNETFVLREDSTTIEKTVAKINQAESPLTIYLRSDYFAYTAVRRF